MAESTLTLLHETISDEISDKFFGTPDHTDLTDAEETKIDNIIRAGYMQFLYPPASGEIQAGYEWSFMKPWTTLPLIASESTGTVEVSTTTCTLTGGTWPTWAATRGILTIDSTEYTITTRTDATHLEVSAEGDVTAGETDWEIEHNGDYTLPDDFGRLIDGYYFSRDDQERYILGDVDAGRIVNKRAQDDTTGEPRIAAEVIVATDSATGQRREAWFWPRCNTAYTLHYKYEAFIGVFSDGEYPAGSVKFSDTILESCLAAAETRLYDERGIHWEMFVEKMVSSIKRDKKQNFSHIGNVGRAGQSSSSTEPDYGLQIGDTVIQ